MIDHIFEFLWSVKTINLKTIFEHKNKYCVKKTLTKNLKNTWQDKIYWESNKIPRTESKNNNYYQRLLYCIESVYTKSTFNSNHFTDVHWVNIGCIFAILSNKENR